MAIIVQTISDDVPETVTSTAPDVQEPSAALRQEITSIYNQTCQFLHRSPA